MFNTSYDYSDAHLRYAERIREAQACHAKQRRMMQKFAQALTWLGKRLIVWSERLQTRQTLELQGNESV